MNITGKLKSFFSATRYPLPSALRRGQALVEVTVATLIAAMTTISVFSVVLSATVSQGKADKREAAALVLKQAQETLKSYVSADPLNTNIIPGITPVKSGSPMGPGGAGRWVYDTSGAWALAAGGHDISSLLTGTLLQAPGVTCASGQTCSLTYTVTDRDCGFGSGIVGSPAGSVSGNTTCKEVVFTLIYPN
ncbi:MAG: hypothetical protein KKH28_04885 [Elusimicrobia bacterium]|nr:hypothetical protein [Elusimicrobiota bacterium]